MKFSILKGTYCLFLSLFLASPLFAQTSSVSIGTETIKDKAVLWLKANGNQGLLIPVVSRAGFSGLNNSDEKGMLIFDPTDNKVYFWNGSAWTEAGGGSGAVTLVGDVTGAASATQVTGLKSKALPATLPSSTQALFYNGTSWVFQGITSATITDATIVDADIANTTITAAKLAQSGATSGQVLKYNGTSWAPAADDSGAGAAPTLSNGQIITGNGTVNVATALSGDATLNLGALTIAANAITSAKILDGTITTADIANGTILAADLNAMSATNGQVLKFNGTAWAPAADDTGTGAPLLANGQILIGNGTTNSASTLSGDATLNAGALTISNNAITSAKINDGAIVAADLNAMSAANGQVLKFNGTAWAPAADNAGISSTLAPANILVGNAGSVATAVAVSGDATLSNAGALTIAANAITSGKINDGTITSADIADATIAAADLNAMSATSGQVLKFNGTAWAPSPDDTGTGAPLLSNGQIITGNGTTNTGTALSGDATLNVGVLTIANNAITSAKINDGTITSADITDGTIAAADLNAMSATNGQVLKYNGTAWAPAADAAGISTTLAPANILVGNAGSVATAVAVSGDATLSNAGALTIAANAITSAKISDGTITSADIADGTIADADIAGVAASKVSGLATDVVPRSNGTGLAASGILSDGSHVGVSGAYNTAYAFQVNSESNFEDAVYFNDDHGNSGDVLVSQAGSGPPIWADPASLSAGFSTLNTVPKGNGTGMVASLLFDNGTNVGIGTTTPAQKLDVNGSINMAAGSFLYLGGIRIFANTLTSNTFAGRNAGLNTTGNHNTFFGFQSGMNTTTGVYNTFIARGAGDANTTGNYNVYVGADAGFSMATGELNTFVGFNAGFDGNGLQASTFIGNKSGENNATGNFNTFVGERSGNLNNGGAENTFIGRESGDANVSGDQITLLGAESDVTVTTLTNATAIGYGATVGANNSLVLGNNANVGIGTSTPTTRLHIVSPIAGYVASFDRNIGTGTEMLAFYRQGVFRGDITESGGTVTYNPFTGSHYSYSNEVFEPGMLVTMTGKNFRLGDDGEPVYEVIASTTANDPKLLGSYLHTRDKTPGTEKDIKVIMAVGNGFMWIADNGEDVATGDYLISSDIAGHAMKDQGQFEISYIIARAAEDVDWQKETAMINGVKHKRISVFYESFTKNYKAERLETEVSKLRAEVDAMKETSKGKMDKMEQEMSDLRKMMEAFRQN